MPIHKKFYSQLKIFRTRVQLQSVERKNGARSDIKEKILAIKLLSSVGKSSEKVRFKFSRTGTLN